MPRADTKEQFPMYVNNAAFGQFFDIKCLNLSIFSHVSTV
jgi:hypothetical protein